MMQDGNGNKPKDEAGRSGLVKLRGCPTAKRYDAPALTARVTSQDFKTAVEIVKKF